MKLAIKIDVDTLRGTERGVPRMVEILRARKAGATFLFSLGPDHTGRALRRVFRKDFLKKVSRTSVLEHYGLRTLLYGTLLPGPDIGRRCKPVWGAAGWQTNRHAAWFQERNFAYASDTRGTHPFRPLWSGVQVGCPQLPTTLPTFDELLGIELDPVKYLLDLTLAPKNHVFTAHAELEGGRFAPLFDALIEGWQAQGYEVVAMIELYQSLDLAALPRHEVVYGEVPGRSGTLALQGAS